MTGKLIKWGLILVAAYFTWQWVKGLLNPPTPTPGLQSNLPYGWTPYGGGTVILQGGGPYPGFRMPTRRPIPY
jgi:TRAP-type C4-dicarboxylate transport system permease small subunit